MGREGKKGGRGMMGAVSFAATGWQEALGEVGCGCWGSYGWRALSVSVCLSVCLSGCVVCLATLAVWLAGSGLVFRTLSPHYCPRRTG